VVSQANRVGLGRAAFDLHVHTPASGDWRDRPVEPIELVDHSIALGLKGIAITDHATGAWVDKLSTVAAKSGLVVFPGVELNIVAGNDGIHLIALFDLHVTSSDIDRFLTTVGALQGAGQGIRRGTTTHGPLEVLNEIGSFGGIAVLAHCRSDKGALGSMRGDLRTSLVRHSVLMAVEVLADDYFDDAKRAGHKRVYDLLDGTDAQYQRELAVYQASDNPSGLGHGHGLAGIGTRFTYFWVEEPITLESLRQSFVDRDARIELPALGAPIQLVAPRTTPAITSLKVTGGFLDELALEFHDGLTTILGPKGSGKSIAVELLRFGLDQEPTQAEIRKDHDTKLAKQLGLYGRVEVSFRSADGGHYSVEREYNPAAHNPFRGTTRAPAELFACHFLSQGEIVRIAESEDEQIRFIDSFFDFRSHQRGIDEIRAKLAGLDGEVAKEIRARKSVQMLAKAQKAFQEEIKAKEDGLKSPTFPKYQQAQAKTQALKRGLEAIQWVVDALAQGRNGLESVPAAPDPPEALGTDPQIRRMLDLSRRAKSDGLMRLAEALDGAGALLTQAKAESDAWIPLNDAIANEYSDEVQKAGGDQRALSQARARAVGDLAKVEDQLNSARQVAALLTPTVATREQLLTALRERLAAYSAARQERCEWFAAKSNGQIRARVAEGSNRDDFRERLLAMKRGPYLSTTEIEAVVATVTPDEFVRSVLRYDLNGKEAELESIASRSKIPLARIVALAGFLLGDGDGAGYEGLLELQYAATPTDRPEISFRREDGTFSPLAEVSTGQKCTALLVMALCEGDAPIVVDQPEDSLDIRSIWEDMCLRLRVSKRNRQFAFTTHNSSLAVASDSDKFLVLAADAQHGEVVLAGAIDHEDVRREVLQLLEGGTATYFLKQRKYNVHDPWGRST
jgi:ABC-type lipoprotein export system ATPase subunit